jgi:alkylation response protein AidB-like acyl-CoA dehydrogenase
MNMPTMQEFERGCLEYRQHERRDGMYKTAHFLVGHFWGQPAEMVEREAWLVRQAYEAGLKTLERSRRAQRDAALAKANIAALAESVLTRLCRIAGGGVFARRSPLGYWFEDVRALGFLRPPWSLASDALFEMSWEEAN